MAHPFGFEGRKSNSNALVLYNQANTSLIGLMRWGFGAACRPEDPLFRLVWPIVLAIPDEKKIRLEGECPPNLP
jgi:hypothetical protein